MFQQHCKQRMDWTRKWPMNSEQLGFSQSATIVGIAEATCGYIIPTTWKWFELAMIAAVRLLLALMISRQSAMSQWTVAAERLNYLAQPTVWVQQWHRSLSLSRSTPVIIWFCGFERYKRAEYMLKSLLGILPYQVFCLVVEPPPLKKNSPQPFDSVLTTVITLAPLLADCGWSWNGAHVQIQPFVMLNVMICNVFPCPTISPHPHHIPIISPLYPHYILILSYSILMISPWPMLFSVYPHQQYKSRLGTS